MTDHEIYDELRAARIALNDKCCGELDSAGVCFAPACRQGRTLKAMDDAIELIERLDLVAKQTKRAASDGR